MKRFGAFLHCHYCHHCTVFALYHRHCHCRSVVERCVCVCLCCAVDMEHNTTLRISQQPQQQHSSSTATTHNYHVTSQGVVASQRQNRTASHSTTHSNNTSHSSATPHREITQYSTSCNTTTPVSPHTLHTTHTTTGQKDRVQQQHNVMKPHFLTHLKLSTNWFYWGSETLFWLYRLMICLLFRSSSVVARVPFYVWILDIFHLCFGFVFL